MEYNSSCPVYCFHAQHKSFLPLARKVPPKTCLQLLKKNHVSIPVKPRSKLTGFPKYANIKSNLQRFSPHNRIFLQTILYYNKIIRIFQPNLSPF